MAGGGIKISNIKVNGGADGATFIPSVSSDGVLSWTNNKGYTNPTSVNIKGKDGKDGKDGVNGANIVSTILQGQDANGGNIYKQTFSNGATANFTAPRGAMGATGAKGDKGDSGNPSGNILQETGTSTEDTISQNAITEALKTWLQRQNAEEDLNALSNVENGKAFISRYITTTANTPSNYGNIISYRNDEGGSTQIALETQNGKMFYRASSTPGGVGTWREVDIITAKNLGERTGYIRYSSGLIIQWGVTNSAADSWTGTITFPIAFSSSTSYIPVAFPSTQTVSVSYSILAADNLTFGRNTSSGAFNIYWIAIGY